MPRQFELISVNKLAQLARIVQKHNLPTPLNSRQDPIVILSILPHPRIHINYIHSLNALADPLGQTAQPLRQQLGPEAVVTAHVCQVDDHLELAAGLVLLECKKDVVDKKVAVDLRGLKVEVLTVFKNYENVALKSVDSDINI